MAQKLTQKSIAQIQRILDSINWAHKYIHDSDVEIVQYTNLAITPESTYNRKSDNKIYTSINKEIDSPLCGIDSAKSILETIIHAGRI